MTYKTHAAAVSAAILDMVGPESIGLTADDSHWHAHAAGGPNNVLLVIAMRTNGERMFGVFSTIATARAWAREIDPWTGENGMIVTAPYVIDCPEFGNIEMGDRN